MILSLLEKFDDALCRILESNPILDHCTRLGMSDEGYWLMMKKEEKPEKVKAPGVWGLLRRKV